MDMEGDDIGGLLDEPDSKDGASSFKQDYDGFGAGYTPSGGKTPI